jgi:uncharacterized protein (DUF111 family)
MDIPQSVRRNALNVYALLADAESAAHGKEAEPFTSTRSALWMP